MFRNILVALALTLASPAIAHDHHGVITATDAFSRATLPGAPVGGAYLTLTNTGEVDDRLLSASSEAAGRITLHKMAMDGDRMVMSALPDGLPLPAGESVTLSPSGMHLMLEDLTGPLKEGETITVTLAFEQADAMMVEVPVMALNADSAGHHHHHH